MDVELNPRPNHKLQRCCGVCKYFRAESTITKKGFCVLPDGPKMTRDDLLKLQLDSFAKTHIHCYCDNHQWRSRAGLVDALKYSGVDGNEFR